MESGDFNFFDAATDISILKLLIVDCWPSISDETYEISKPANTAVGSAPASCWITSATSILHVNSRMTKAFPLFTFFVNFLPQPNVLRNSKRIKKKIFLC